jgi:hypothetical protein
VSRCRARRAAGERQAAIAIAAKVSDNAIRVKPTRTFYRSLRDIALTAALGPQPYAKLLGLVQTIHGSAFGML